MDIIARGQGFGMKKVVLDTQLTFFLFKELLLALGFFYFLCACVLPVCICKDYVHAWCPWTREEGLIPSLPAASVPRLSCINHGHVPHLSGNV